MAELLTHWRISHWSTKNLPEMIDAIIKGLSHCTGLSPDGFVHWSTRLVSRDMMNVIFALSVVYNCGCISKASENWRRNRCTPPPDKRRVPVWPWDCWPWEKKKCCCCCCGDGRGSGCKDGGEDPQKGIHNLLERIRNAHSLVRISPSFWSGLLLRKYTRNTEIEVNMEFIEQHRGMCWNSGQ